MNLIDFGQRGHPVYGLRCPGRQSWGNPEIADFLSDPGPQFGQGAPGPALCRGRFARRVV
jgi:hypothetical protein